MDNFKKTRPEPAIRPGDTGQRIPCFDSCQLITTLMYSFLLGSLGSQSSRKCESKHWYAYGADGQSGGRSVVVRSRDSRVDSLPQFLAHGAPQSRFARQSSAISLGLVHVVVVVWLS